MASPTPRRTAPASASSTGREIVDPRWLLKALALALLAALICAYLAVCLLVYMGFRMNGGLSPVAVVDRTPAADGIPFETVHFDAAATGRPRLTGWWIASGSERGTTILFLHGDGGSLSRSEGKLAMLHHLNANLFAIDYRGYGQSDGPHPSEARMRADSDAALDYLVDTRHIPMSSIVVQGEGYGASLAAVLAREHPELPAVILDNPDPDAVNRPLNNQRSLLLPMRLLVGRPFDIGAQLAGVKQPKLLIAGGYPAVNPHLLQIDQPLFRAAPEPKMSVTLPDSNNQEKNHEQYLAAVSRFLDEYLPGKK